MEANQKQTKKQIKERSEMKIKTALLALLTCWSYTAVYGCIADHTEVCHAATPGTMFRCPDGVYVRQNYDTEGDVTMAYGGAAKGYDGVGYFNTTCDYSTKNEDCLTIITTTPHSDPWLESYATGNRCGEW